MYFFNERRNNEDIIKKIGETKVKEIGGRCKPKKKWLEIIGKNIRAYGVDIIVVKEIKGQMESIRIAMTSPVWDGDEDKEEECIF